MVQNALKLANTNPHVIAYISGKNESSKIKGTVEFFEWTGGSIVKLEITGLPKMLNNFLKFSIQDICECEKGDILKTTNNCIDDLPMIYSNNGYAYMLYYTSKFTPKEVVGRFALIQEIEGSTYEIIGGGKILKRRWMFI